MAQRKWQCHGSSLLLMQVRLGCNAELILDEFGEKLLEELDYQQEARNIQVSTLSDGCSCILAYIGQIYACIWALLESY